MRHNKIFFQSSLALVLITILLGGVFTSPALAFSDGPTNPGAGANVSTIGTEPWVNPDEITSPGSPYSTVNLYHLHLYTNYLQGTQYGFNLPSDALVQGIEVRINRMATGRNPSLLDNMVSLLKNGILVGESRATTDPWPTTLTVATYGGPTDLWGTDWTPADINAMDFGVALTVSRENNGVKIRKAIVDTMQITVYYNLNATTAVVCGDGSPVMYGESVVCVATVTNPAGNPTPAGTIDWSSDGDGTFEPTQCLLEVTGGVTTCSATYTPTMVGTGVHQVTAAYSGDGFFTPSSAVDDLDITLRPVTVTADAQTKVYNDPDPELSFQVTGGSLAFNDTFTGALTREPGEDVSSYAILQGSLALSENYALTFVGNDLTITPMAITVTADPQTKRPGQPDPELTYQVTSGTLALGDTFTGELTREPGEDVGTYAILQGSLALSENYVLTYVGNDLTITLISVTITADPQTKHVGQPDPALTYQVTSGTLLPGDTFTGELNREPGEDIGVYAILQGTLSLPNYYDFTFVGADFTITKTWLLLPLVFR